MSECMFHFNGECKVLKVNKCSEKCRFRKTEEEFRKGILDAENRLKEKGLKRVILPRKGGEYVSVKPIDEEDY